jgi:hypothetical protein
MNFFAQPQPQNLSAWLDIATRNLVPSAQARVRAEIEAHFADAVRSKQTAGATEPNAQGAALVELGNPRTAARRFAREYLTRQDVRKLGFDHTREDVSLRQAALAAILFFGWIALHNGNDENFRTFDRLYYTGLLYIVVIGAVIAVAFPFLAAFWPSPRVMARRTLSLRLILLIFFCILAPAVAVWCMRPLSSPWLLTACITGLLAAGVYAIRSLFLLREKLRHATDADFAPPPPAKN